MESPANGVLVQIIVQPKQEVAVGAVLGILAQPGETITRVEGASDSPASAVAEAGAPPDASHGPKHDDRKSDEKCGEHERDSRSVKRRM